MLTVDPPPERFCSNHNQFVRTEGGAYVKFNNGRNRRWFCKACIERRRKHKNEETKT